MRRTLMLAAILFGISSLVAAPVPAVPRVDPYAAGAISLKDLERIPFPDPSAHGPALPRSAETALYMPTTRFKSGEPIPAYFLVRNATQKPIGLDMRFDLFDELQSEMNSCRIDVRDLATGQRASTVQLHVSACGGGSRLEVRANGYYIARGDLSRSGDGFLPPGDYEASWMYTLERTRSNAVRFSVLGPATKAMRKPLPCIRFVRVQPQAVAREKVARLDDAEGSSITLRKPSLSTQDAGHSGAWFGTGIGGKYYPNIAMLPRNDGQMIVAADWYFAPKGDRVTVTLEAMNPKRPIEFDDYPHVYLQIETTGREDGARALDETKMADMQQVSLTTPLTMTIELPRNWRAKTGATGPGNVAVVVTSEEMPHWGDIRIRDVMERTSSDQPRWSGVLRSDFTMVEFSGSKSAK